MYAQATEVITSQGDLRRGDSSGNPERLAIGSANQLLQSDGTTESWATVADLAPPTTTKGDLSGFSTVSARIPVGTNNYTILADSAQALGLKYGASSTSILSASGDILYASGANTLAKLAKATDGDTLQLASGVPAWVTVSAGGGAWKSIETQTNGSTFNIGSVGGSLFSAYRFIKIYFQWQGSSSNHVQFELRDSATAITGSDYDEIYHREDVASSQLYQVDGASEMFQGYTESGNTIFGRMEFPVSPTGAGHVEVMWKNCSSGNNDINYDNGVTRVYTTNDITGIYLLPEFTPAITASSCTYEVLGLA